MVESSKSWVIRNHIKGLLTESSQLTRAEILERCLHLASEPTIHAVLKKMISEGEVDEFEKPREKIQKEEDLPSITN